MSAKTPEEILKGIEQDFLHMPYNKYVWMRLEFALICNDELEALILRIVEYSIEGQRLAWVREATDLASQGKPIPPEPQWWCSFSYRQFMSYLYGVVKNEKTIIKKLNSLINVKKFLLRREDPDKPYASPQYTINKEVVQGRLNGLPKKLPTLREVVEYHSQHNQPVPSSGTPNDEENDRSHLVVPPVPSSGTPRTITGDSPVPASGGDPYQLVVPNKNSKNITESSKNVEEENALSSIDETRTLSSSSNSPSSLQESVASETPFQPLTDTTQPLSEENGTSEPALPEIEAQREKEASTQANGVSDSQENTEQTSSSKGNRGSRKPRKPTVSDDQRKRIDHVYDVLDALGCEVTESESYHYQRTKSDDDLILNWFKCSPTEEMLGDVYRKLWNTPKDTKSGFDWKENMSIRAVLKQYDRLALGIKANKQKEAKKTQVSDTKQVVETIATLAASAGYKNQIWDDDDLEYLPPVSKKQGA